MKKIYNCFLLVVFLLLVSACDSDNDNSTIKDGTYVMVQDDTEEVLLPRVIIEENKIVFSHDLLSSYMPFGTYTIDDDILTMTTDDNKYTYTFKIDGDNLIFQKDESSSIKMVDNNFGALVSDHSIFMLTEEKPSFP